MSTEEIENYYLIQAGTEYRDYERYEMEYVTGIIRIENNLYKCISEDCNTSEIGQTLQELDDHAFYWCFKAQEMLIKGNGLVAPNVGIAAAYAENLFLKYGIPYPQNMVEIVTNQFNLQKEVKYDTDEQIDKKHATFIALLESRQLQDKADPAMTNHLKNMANFLKQYRTNFCRYKNGTYGSSEKKIE